MDLRKAAAQAAQPTTYHYDSEQSCYDDQAQKSDSDMDYPMHKLTTTCFPPRKESRRTLRLTTSSPVLHQQYQSDEEQPSPSPNSYTDSYEEGEEGEEVGIDAVSDSGSCEADTELDDYTDDETSATSSPSEFPTPRPEPSIITAAALAVAIPILAVGRPRIVSISSLAPMHKRATPVVQSGSRLSASSTTLRRFRAPVPTIIRPSTPPRQLANQQQQDASLPTGRTASPSTSSTLSESAPPSHTHSGSSPASSAPSSVCDDTSDAEHENHNSSSSSNDNNNTSSSLLVLRDSANVRARSAAVLAGTEWDPAVLEAPTPVSYAAYDPFALAPPTLGLGKGMKEVGNAGDVRLGEGRVGRVGRVTRWKGLGLRARVRPSRKTTNMRRSDHVEV